MVDLILFPSDFFNIAKVDEDLQKEFEAGDGGVSGLSENQNYEQYFRALYTLFMEETT
ncbi:MAG: hypothetical protein K6F84_01485 [Lachnospiraceae bacterium]|nr:hypothetical protein [Lachnospiraceae bacterium]